MSTESHVIVIDHGNTATKVTLFCGDKVVATSRQDAPMVETVAMLCARYPVSGAVYCTVVGVDIRFVETVRCLLAPAKMLVLTHSTPLPLGVRYVTVFQPFGSCCIEAYQAISISLCCGSI